MKFRTLLLVGALALGPVGCNRSKAPDDSVSANADRVDQSSPVSSQENSKTTTQERQRPVARETRPATRAPAPRNNNEAVQTTPTHRTETVSSGTAFTVTLADAISTDANKEGDPFTAHLSQPIIVNGSIVANKGDRVSGHVSKLEEPGRVKGRARLELVLDEIRTSKDTHKLSTEPFIGVGGDSHTRDAEEIGGGAAVGAAIGAIAGGAKGAAIGAVIGGGTGTTAVLVTRGKQLHLEPEMKLNFVLSRDVNLPVIRMSTT